MQFSKIMIKIDGKNFFEKKSSSVQVKAVTITSAAYCFLQSSYTEQ
jgi:hypothetical protein